VKINAYMSIVINILRDEPTSRNGILLVGSLIANLGTKET